jgi:hypothetical protein
MQRGSNRTTKLVFILSVALSALLPVNTALAQGKGGKTQQPQPIALSHEAPLAQVLPFPGQKIILKVTLQNTKAPAKELRTFVSVDGRALELPAPKNNYDTGDRPTYEIEAFAPLAELAYHFVATLENGTVITSPRYMVRRDCIPSSAGAENKNELSPQSPASDRVRALLIQSESLGNDLASVDSAIQLISSLQEALAKR